MGDISHSHHNRHGHEQKGNAEAKTCVPTRYYQREKPKNPCLIGHATLLERNAARDDDLRLWNSWLISLHAPYSLSDSDVPPGWAFFKVENPE